MARKTQNKNTKSSSKNNGRKADSAIVFELKLIVMALVLAVILASVHGANLGVVGDLLRSLFSGLFSWSMYVVPYLLALFLSLFFIKKLDGSRTRYGASLLLGFFVSTLVVGLFTKSSVFFKILSLKGMGEAYNAGKQLIGSGLIGNTIFAPLYSLLGDVGIILLIISLILAILSLLTKFTFSKLMTMLGLAVKKTGDRAVEGGKKLGDAIGTSIDKLQTNSLEQPVDTEDRHEDLNLGADSSREAHLLDAFKKPAPEKSDFEFIDAANSQKMKTELEESLGVGIESNGKNEVETETGETAIEGDDFKFIEIPESRSVKSTGSDLNAKIELIGKTLADNASNAACEGGETAIGNQNADIEISEVKDEIKVQKKLDENKKTNNKIERTTKKMPNKDETSEDDLEIDENVSPYENYELPPIEILLKGDTETGEIGRKDIELKARILEDTFKSFKVDADVVSAERGPMITRFEVRPKPGVKISKIASLNDDIAMKLAATNVRILAPIPGKPAVGIEVPNESVSIVRLRDVLESNVYKKEESLIRFGLGKDISGKDIVPDLAKMPHLLIAGATGSGKSVCVNTIISSILFNAKPDEVKFLMIDPKVVELNIYNGIPHLLLPVVTDAGKASVALAWAVGEMNRRYAEFAKFKVRDISSYNQKRENTDEIDGEFMPRVVIIIDELADLMMVAQKQVEESIARIAQMARAAGMHLIVATQRPSVDVITGVIKANIPSRIAFAVSSHIDSRTIIDEQGADKLLGKGDMLFLNAGKSKPTRTQGSFITDTEVEALVSFVKNQIEGEPDYDDAVLDAKNIVGVDGTAAADDSDPLLQSAIDFVIQSEKASTSMVQRKFKIGYNRAARIIEMMEDMGVVGPSRGAKPREVLVGMAYMDLIEDASDQTVESAHEE